MNIRVLKSNNYAIRFFARGFFIWFLVVNSAAAQERQIYVDSAEYLEMVRVEVLNVEEDGSGVLRVNMHDCGGCTQNFEFTQGSILESPLGTYQGLVKLSDWDDHNVLVVVGKQDGIVRRVTVN